MNRPHRPVSCMPQKAPRGALETQSLLDSKPCFVCSQKLLCTALYITSKLFCESWLCTVTLGLTSPNSSPCCQRVWAVFMVTCSSHLKLHSCIVSTVSIPQPRPYNSWDCACLHVLQGDSRACCPQAEEDQECRHPLGGEHAQQPTHANAEFDTSACAHGEFTT